MNIIIIDTETTDLNKCFCYNIGYVIANTENNFILEKKNFVVEQIWHNLPLFTTAYYANKRENYIKEMKCRKTKMLKFGYICQEILRDIKKYNIVCGYAYNSSFDEKVFTFNCDWFKCVNPLENIPVYDIRGLVHNFLINNDFIKFCEKNKKFTDSGNYSTTAETIYQYIKNDVDFIEDHTALSDSLIEYEILKECIKNGGQYDKKYLAKKTIERKQEKILIIKTNSEEFKFKCYKYKVYKNKNLIKID